MSKHKTVAVLDGPSIKILAATQDEYQVFIRLSPTLVLGHAVLLDKHYLHLYKENRGAYYFHGSVYFNERPDGAVIWNVNLACDISEGHQKEAKELAAQSAEFANRFPGVGIFLQLLSAAAFTSRTDKTKPRTSKKRRPTPGPTRTTHR